MVCAKCCWIWRGAVRIGTWINDLAVAQIWMASAKTDVFDRIIGAARAHDFAEYICLALLVAGFVVFGAYQFGVKILADFKAMAGGVVYVDEPGWKYPTELTESERADFNAKLSVLPTRLSEKIEVEWRKNSWNGSE